MFGFLEDIGNYKDRCVARFDSDDNGVGVSTAFTSDEGYETALLCGDEVHPIERYESKDLAIVGHNRWVEKSKSMADGDVINKLGGFGGLVDDELVVIQLN